MMHDFEDIEVKRSAAEILEAQLKRKRKPCMISTGSMCDPYIPLEESLRLTRQCLEIIERHGFGLSILTKSARILRDIDILRAINEKTKCVVQMTMTTYDEQLCKIIEPNVSSTAERFHALEAMRDAGIPTVVWLTPILPFINDTEDNLRGILDYCARAKVRGIISFGGFGVTLRDGDREYFYANLDRSFPGMKERYVWAFGNSYQCGSPNNTRLTQVFNSLCREYGIMHNSDKIFAYIHKFEQKHNQLSLF
jgi:DNA repair photolyase